LLPGAIGRLRDQIDSHLGILTLACASLNGADG
jgi:hypothetical protein